MNYRVGLPVHLTAATLTAAIALTAPGTAFAQQKRLSMPAMPLSQALQRIADETGEPINIDPDAVADLTSNPVNNARNTADAVRQATRDLHVQVVRDDRGRFSVLNGDIVVRARRDEAETSVLVRRATTSSRLGQSLRDQPRNTQVISAKLLQDQQVQSLTEALANAGGVVVNQATIQGGVNFTVRGFTSNGSVNGMPSAAGSTFAAGANQPLANIERIEVLKGPDAILLGGDSLGGTINIVTKKPSAEERLYLSADTGSFGLMRGTIDANRALGDDDLWSARIIATAGTADRNFGGYRGNEDYLFAPSLRFKSQNTDVILSASLSNQIFGAVPYTVLDPATKTPFNFAFDRPVIGGRDQFAQTVTTQFNLEVTQKVSDWLTVVARGQHQKADFKLAQYSPFVLLAPNGLLLGNGSGVRQQANTDVIDSYARINFGTGIFTHKIVAGYTRFDTNVNVDNADNGGFFVYNFLNPTAAPPPLATRFSFAIDRQRLQDGFYGQYLLSFWKLHLLAGLRHNITRDRSTVVRVGSSDTTTRITTPNYGAVLDVTDDFSIFGTLAYGFQPTLSIGEGGARLPDVRTRNAEAGIKWDLFGDRVLVNASWFTIRESNRIRRIAGFDTATPGIEGTGIDLNVSGEPLPGLSVTAAFTRTKYKFLSFDPRIGGIVNAQPRDTYNVYASYRHSLSDDVKAGLGGGITGRSSSAVDSLGVYYLPASWQADANAFVSWGDFDLNVGVRNLTDRQNYFPTIAPQFVPIGEPRQFRVSLGYRFR